MDFGAALSVAQTLFAALQCKQLQELWSIFNYKPQLDVLTRTVKTVKAVLLHAQAMQDFLSPETQRYVEDLRDTLYDADDLLDEFLTLVYKNQVMKGSKFSKKVRNFFSRYNQVGLAYNMSQGVKKITKKLELIARNHNEFGLRLDHNPIRRRREETCSYVKSTDIIGRDEDLGKIVAKLLDPGVVLDVSFLTIVGMGGLGKTALAQLVYNDERIKKHFPLRLWTCVSDQDQNRFDVKAILAHILEANQGGESLDLLQRQLRGKLAGKRFLLVLDDVWTENRVEWCNLVRLLTGGESGSWVVVTSRSQETANIVAINSMHKLTGLSKENSWHLFQLAAFDQPNTNAEPEFTNIGRDIVKKCSNVPLAIRVVGSLLYGQEKSKWVSVRDFGVTTNSGIMDILKFSYHNLEPPLRSCFSYCALYPKDYPMKKDDLISLWMAQGYIVPLEKGQSIEDAAEEYYLILLRRCFFQELEISHWRESEQCKMHDLMHDIALQVVEKEVFVMNSSADVVSNKVRHASLVKRQYTEYSFNKAHLRTFLLVGICNVMSGLPVASLVSNYKCLRSLDLSALNIRNLPNSIGELLHLRCLNVSFNHHLEFLPNSITKLYNLQTLDLEACSRLKELPEDLSKLLNLRALGLNECYRLTCMPQNMERLTGLHKLTQFVVSEGSSRKQHAELEGLKALKNLSGYIIIRIQLPQTDTCFSRREGAYLSNKEHLTTVVFCCQHKGTDEGANDYEEELIGDLQPHSSLKILRLEGYRGVQMPRWAREENLASSFRNLVELELSGCSELKCLSLGNLQCLKVLELDGLSNLEIIENHLFTASLVNLFLTDLPKLKGFRKRREEKLLDNTPSSDVSLSNLKSLSIVNCPSLSCIPHCPHLTWLLINSDEKVESLSDYEHVLRKCSSSLQNLTVTQWPRLKSVSGGLKCLSGLDSLTLGSIPIVDLGDAEDESEEEGEGMPWGSLHHTLRKMSIGSCTELVTLPKWMRKFTSLQTLTLFRCSAGLNQRCQSKRGGLA